MAVKYWTLSFQVWFSSSISKEIFTRWYAFIYFHSLYIFLPQYKFSRKIYFLLFNKLLFIFSIRRNIFLDVILFKFSFIYNLLRHDITYLPSKSVKKLGLIFVSIIYISRYFIIFFMIRQFSWYKSSYPMSRIYLKQIFDKILDKITQK